MTLLTLQNRSQFTNGSEAILITNIHKNKNKTERVQKMLNTYKPVFVFLLKNRFYGIGICFLFL